MKEFAWRANPAGKGKRWEEKDGRLGFTEV
jgi:hypothetical protein